MNMQFYHLMTCVSWKRFSVILQTSIMDGGIRDRAHFVSICPCIGHYFLSILLSNFQIVSHLIFRVIFEINTVTHNVQMRKPKHREFDLLQVVELAINATRNWTQRCLLMMIRVRFFSVRKTSSFECTVNMTKAKQSMVNSENTLFLVSMGPF